MHTSNEDQHIDLAIIGGGIAGLSLALGILNQAPHINIHIYEAAQQFSEIGAGVGLSRNAAQALWKLDPRMKARLGEIAPYMEDTSCEKRSSNDDITPEKNAAFLRFIMGMDHRHDPKYKAGSHVCNVFRSGGNITVHRTRFLDLLVSLLPESVRRNRVSLGARLVAVEESGENSTGVKLIFANGTTAVADAIIGCDGIKSQMRRILLGGDSPASRPVFSGKYAYRGLIPMAQAVTALGEATTQSGHHRIGYDGHVLTFPIDGGRILNVVAFKTKSDGQWEESEEWVQPSTKQDMYNDFADWGQDVHSIIGLMQKCDRWALFDHAPASTYYSAGRICIIRDAAHATTPHHGAGAGFAIEDAFILSDLMRDVQKKQDIQRVFETFDVQRRERTQRLVRSSREQAALYELQDQDIGDDIEKLAQIMPGRWDWIWDYDVEHGLKQARGFMETLQSNEDNTST